MAHHAGEDEGFSLIELLVAMALIGVVMTGLAFGLTTALDVTADSRERTIAANLASQEIDLATAVPADELQEGTLTHAELVNGMTFTIRRVSTWQQGEAQAPACTALANSAVGRGRQFLLVDVEVTWPGIGLRGPVGANTAITPSVASYQDGRGHVAVTIVDRDGAPLTAGLPVRLTGTGTRADGGTESVDRTVTSSTNIGCAFFSDLWPGTYTVTVTPGAYVDADPVTPDTEQVQVEDRATAKTTFVYDGGAGLNLTVAGQFGGTVFPNGMVVTAESNHSTASQRVSGVGTGGSAVRRIGVSPDASLAPYPGGWDVWAGCAHNRPELDTWLESGTRLVTSNVVTPGPNQIANGSVSAGTLQVRANGLRSVRSGATLYAFDTAFDTGPPSASPCATPLVLGTFGTAGSFVGDVALPIGDWRLAYGTSPNTSAALGTTIRVGPYRAATYVEVLSYFETVLADAPFLYHRFDENPISRTAVDSSGTGRNGQYQYGILRGTPGALPGDTSTGARLEGTATSFISNAAQIGNPNQFSVETWFRTTSTSGGRLIGFSNSQTGTSSQHDRHLYMLNGGQVVWGVRPSAYRTVQSPAAYNDGAWHHAVGTLGTGGMALYVDGQLVGRRSDTTTGQNASGYVRVGVDTLSGWPGPVTSSAFRGELDEPAAYTSTLSAARVSAHYAARSGGAYATVVRADNPYVHYRLNDVSALDSSGNSRHGTYQAGVTGGTIGALLNDTNRAATFTNTGFVANPVLVANPNAFSLELWFRTSNNRGGKLIGFGNGSVANSTSYDRQIWMLNNGRLLFGTQPGGYQTITTAQFYRDDLWHHVVATQGPQGMALYVDGQLAGTNPTTTAGAYSGSWRVGFDTLTGWQGPWTNQGLIASIDEVAVYSTVLSAEQVRAHYQASGR